MLRIINVSKSFPGVQALDNVSLDFIPGEIHGLIGENGAGKSTCIKIISGLLKKDSGEIQIDGQQVRFYSYREAIEHNIGLVPQELSIIPLSSVAENIVIDKLPRYSRRGKINWKRIYSDARQYLDMVGLRIDPKTVIADVGVAQKQLIQIAKTLSTNAKYLFLDEPTSALTPNEAGNLFQVLKRLKEKQVSIIFVSHKIEELMSICDRLSILRDGKLIATKIVDEKLHQADIIKPMVGRNVEIQNFGQLQGDRSVKVLELVNISQENTFSNVNLSLYQGEILGFYGLVGSGRTELAKIIIGEDSFESGKIIKNGREIRISSMKECLHKHKIGYVSENRKEEGLLLKFSVKENINITVWKKIARYFSSFIHPDLEQKLARQYVDRLSIKTYDLSQSVETLSGGNQQKTSIAKWLAAECDILIIDEPTIGVDIGAKGQIHQIIWELASVYSKSVILISSDLPELISLSSRILVFNEFTIRGEVENVDLSDRYYNLISDEIGQYIS